MKALAALGIAAGLVAGCGTSGADGTDPTAEPTESDDGTSWEVPASYCDDLAGELLPGGSGIDAYLVDGEWGEGGTRDVGDPYVCDIEPRDRYIAATSGEAFVGMTLSLYAIGADSPSRDEYAEVASPLDDEGVDWAEYLRDSEQTSGAMECESDCDGAGPVQVQMFEYEFGARHDDFGFHAVVRYFLPGDAAEAEETAMAYASESFGRYVSSGVEAVTG